MVHRQIRKMYFSCTFVFQLCNAASYLSEHMALLNSGRNEALNQRPHSHSQRQSEDVIWHLSRHQSLTLRLIVAAGMPLYGSKVHSSAPRPAACWFFHAFIKTLMECKIKASVSKRSGNAVPLKVGCGIVVNMIIKREYSIVLQSTQ